MAPGDYKTNRVEPDRLAEVAAGYEMQMLLYALAVEQVLGRGPDELVLCFLRPGLEFSFPWNESARSRATELIETAIGGAAPRPEGSGKKRQRRLF